MALADLRAVGEFFLLDGREGGPEGRGGAGGGLQVGDPRLLLHPALLGRASGRRFIQGVFLLVPLDLAKSQD